MSSRSVIYKAWYYRCGSGFQPLLNDGSPMLQRYSHAGGIPPGKSRIFVLKCHGRKIPRDLLIWALQPGTQNAESFNPGKDEKMLKHLIN
jgi:hypothetical protein